MQANTQAPSPEVPLTVQMTGTVALVTPLSGSHGTGRTSRLFSDVSDLRPCASGRQATEQNVWYSHRPSHTEGVGGTGTKGSNA